jgi:hypothetical protein
MAKRKTPPVAAKLEDSTHNKAIAYAEAPPLLIFISHDHRDADLAEAFGNLLTDVSGGIIKSFRSSDNKGTSGIAYGADWYGTVMQKLGDATDVVALLTHQSLDRPWILYETGVARGKLNTTVFGLALGAALDDAAKGPFAQFQNSGDDEDSITKLVLQLLRKHPGASPREEGVRSQVHTFKEKVDKILKSRKDEPLRPKSSTDDTSVAKLFEEIKILVRDLPQISSNLNSLLTAVISKTPSKPPETVGATPPKTGTLLETGPTSTTMVIAGKQVVVEFASTLQEVLVRRGWPSKDSEAAQLLAGLETWFAQNPQSIEQRTRGQMGRWTFVVKPTGNGSVEVSRFTTPDSEKAVAYQ